MDASPAERLSAVDTEALRAEFRERGVIRVDGAFAADEAACIREAVWRHAERKLGLQPNEPSTWPQGWLPISWKGLKRNRAFEALMESKAVTTALDAVFGATGWQPPKPGAQVLFTLPAPGPWTMPAGWHMDCGFEEPTWPVFGVKVFAFFGAVGACGGGTMLLPGSHRVVERYRATFDRPPAGGNANWHAFLRRHPPLGDLLRGAELPDRGRSLVGNRYDIDGVPVEVVELTGAPGDVVITHLHVFHSPSPNTSGTPRQMLGKGVSAGRPIS